VATASHTATADFNLQAEVLATEVEEFPRHRLHSVTHEDPGRRAARPRSRPRLDGAAAGGNPVAVTGHVQCTSGAPVVGVYVDTGTSARGFASFDAVESRSAANFAYSVLGGRSYSVHVGCGGTPSAWATDNRSDDVTGTAHSFICADGQAVTERSHYGVCRGQ